MSKELPNFTAFYSAWEKLKEHPGATAGIRRAATTNELLDLPAFYRLVDQFGWQSCNYYERLAWQRLVFLVQHITNGGEDASTLGKALASAKVSEKRLFQIVRADSPRDIEQLRRLLIQASPTVNWSKMAKQLWYWNPQQKRSLLEDFVLSQKD